MYWYNASLDDLLADALELRTKAGKRPPRLFSGRMPALRSTLILYFEKGIIESSAAPAKPPESRLQLSPDAHVRSLVGSRLNVADLLRPHGALWPLLRALRLSVASDMLSQQHTLADVDAASRAMAARAQFGYGSHPTQPLLSVKRDPD